MTSLPYPTFLSSPTRTLNSIALSAVGRVRIHPMTCPDSAIDSDSESLSTSTPTPATLYQEILSQLLLHTNTATKAANELASRLLRDSFQLDVSIIDVEIVLPVAHVIDTQGAVALCFLDAGCASVVMEMGQEDRQHDYQTFLSACRRTCVPRERLILHFCNQEAWITCWEDPVIQREIREEVATISVHVDDSNEVEDSTTVTLIQSIRDESNGNISEESGEGRRCHWIIQFSCHHNSDSMNDGIHEQITGKNQAIFKTFKSALQNSLRCHISLIDPTAYQLGMAYAECIKTDRNDGLYTTVVCTRGGEALGLVYSSKESIIASLQSGRGVYYSRSRNSLWRKGDTSGHYQILHRLDVDCDGDALRFTVTQMGGEVTSSAAFCHLDTFTCWGEPRGLRHLERLLQQRLRDAPAGSYTKRLFEDQKLLRDKLVEEAQELSEAETKQHVAEELADVLYFAMVRAAKVGVSVDDAIMELDKRARKVTRRQGDSKVFRIKAGDEILGNR